MLCIDLVRKRLCHRLLLGLLFVSKAIFMLCSNLKSWKGHSEMGGLAASP